jgi:hypothetical protein
VGVWKLEARVRGFIWAVRRLKWVRMVNCIRLLAVDMFRNTRENCVPAVTAVRYLFYPTSLMLLNIQHSNLPWWMQAQFSRVDRAVNYGSAPRLSKENRNTRKEERMFTTRKRRKREREREKRLVPFHIVYGVLG